MVDDGVCAVTRSTDLRRHARLLHEAHDARLSGSRPGSAGWSPAPGTASCPTGSRPTVAPSTTRRTPTSSNAAAPSPRSPRCCRRCGPASRRWPRTPSTSWWSPRPTGSCSGARAPRGSTGSPTVSASRRGRLDRGLRRDERHRHRARRARVGAAVLGGALRARPAPLDLHGEPDPRPADRRDARGRRPLRARRRRCTPPRSRSSTPRCGSPSRACGPGTRPGSTGCGRSRRPCSPARSGPGARGGRPRLGRGRHRARAARPRRDAAVGGGPVRPRARGVPARPRARRLAAAPRRGRRDGHPAAPRPRHRPARGRRRGPRAVAPRALAPPPADPGAAHGRPVRRGSTPPRSAAPSTTTPTTSSPCARSSPGCAACSGASSRPGRTGSPRASRSRCRRPPSSPGCSGALQHPCNPGRDPGHSRGMDASRPRRTHVRDPVAPRVMKAARFHGPGDIRIDDIAEPHAGPGQVQVAVDWCGICGTDLHEFLEGPIFIPPKGSPHPITGGEVPVVMGHEFAGVVSERRRRRDRGHRGRPGRRRALLRLRGVLACRRRPLQHLPQARLHRADGDAGRLRREVRRRPALGAPARRPAHRHRRARRAARRRLPRGAAVRAAPGRHRGRVRRRADRARHRGRAEGRRGRPGDRRRAGGGPEGEGARGGRGRRARPDRGRRARRRSAT